MSWRERADEAFLATMPGRRRVALEIVLLVALVFGEGLLSASPAPAAAMVAAALALALALVRPWSPVHGGLLARTGATLLVVLAVVAPSAVEHPGLAGPSRRLGIGIAVGAPAEGDPPVAGGIVLVQSVEPRSPADGVLREGDRLVGLGGAPFDRADPLSDLTRRTHGDDLPEDTTVTVLRGGAAQELAVHVPRVHHAYGGFGRSLVALRELSSRHVVVAAALRDALLIGLLLLLVRADRQPLAALGIVRAGASRELLHAGWMLLGTFGVQIAVAIPVALVGALLGIVNGEAARRTQTLGTLADQGSVLELVGALVVAATFEELAFRAFLTPRVRRLTGSWPVAVALVSVVFGLGHVYEGALAIVQITFLGVYFSVVYLARRRLVGPAVAHAAFNGVMLVVVQVVLRSGLVEKLRDLTPH